ncbi:MAG TPA: glycosyltransferase [Clostridia bacterium]|nr:glycosyltransferase [Clostridia bacterium]
MRINCVRELKNQFGPNFIGGVEGTEFAVRNYRDYVADASITKKRVYLELLRSADICVSTAGLRQSNPWKFAEYLAMAKAIVSEPLAHRVPGPLRPGTHYLEFRSPEECVQKAVFLYENPEQRYAMMQQNHHYYQAFLRPDVLVWNTFRTTLGEQLPSLCEEQMALVSRD